MTETGGALLTPELALVDPGLAEAKRQTTQRKAAMSSTEPSNGTFFVDPAQPVPPPATPEPVPVSTPTPAAEHSQAAPAATPMVDVPLGTLIFRAGLLAEEQLEDALQEGMRTGKRLGEVLIERGWLHERDLGRLLAGQKGLPFVEVSASDVDPAALRVLPEEKARLQAALPLRYEEGELVVAVADPSNELLIENLRRAIGSQPRLVVAPHADLLRVIAEAYGAPAAPQAAPPPEPAPQPVPQAVVPPQAQPEAPLQPPLQVEAPAQPDLAAGAIREPEPVQPLTPPAVTPLPTVLPPAEERAAEPPAAPALVQPVEPPVEPVVQPTLAQPVEAPPEPVGQPAVVQPFEPAAPEVVPPLHQQPAPPEELAVPLPPPAPPIDPAVQPADQQPAPEAALQPPVAPAPVAPAVQPPVAASPPPASPEQPVAEPPPADASGPVHAVVLRLRDGETLEVGTFQTAAEAAGRAQQVLAEIASAEASGTWPLFAQRYLRPDTIVSVDMLEESADKWLGSAVRSRWAGQP